RAAEVRRGWRISGYWCRPLSRRWPLLGPVEVFLQSGVAVDVDGWHAVAAGDREVQLKPDRRRLRECSPQGVRYQCGQRHAPAPSVLPDGRHEVIVKVERSLHS